MLIQLSPDIVENQAATLLAFLKTPYSPRGCEYVSEHLPEIAKAYEAASKAFNRNPGQRYDSLESSPELVFQFNAVSDDRDHADPLRQLVQTQVRLLEEEYRDVQDRSVDSHGKRGRDAPGRGTPEQAAMCLRAQALHEAVFLTLVGYFEIRVAKRQLQFELTPLGEQCLWSRARSAFMQLHTDLAARRHMEDVVAELQRRSGHDQATLKALLDQLRADDLDELTARLLDTYFSLSSRMQFDPAVESLLVEARQACRWVAVLELARLAGADSIFLDEPQRLRLQLNSDVLDGILADRLAELPSDLGIERQSDGSLSLGGASLGHALHCCKRSVISMAVARELGEHFERHAIAYIRHVVPKQDYVVREGIKAKAKSKAQGEESYDCDLILFEPERRKVFFVQTKWKRDNRTATLWDELAVWTSANAAMTKGVSQLNVLRRRLSEQKVMQQVVERLKGLGLSPQEIIDGAEFVVVHTQPYFNAYAHEGVAIYEWNLFRNALLRGLVWRRAVDSPAEARSAGRLLRLEDPEDALDYFGELNGVQRESSSAARQIRASVRYGFELPLPRRRWWSRWLGPEQWRVSRPCL